MKRSIVWLPNEAEWEAGEPNIEDISVGDVVISPVDATVSKVVIETTGRRAWSTVCKMYKDLLPDAAGKRCDER